MKKFFKSLLVCLLVLFSCFFASCSSNNSNGNSSSSSSSSSIITISAKNAGQFFDIDVQIKNTYGKIIYYQLTVRLIGNYELESNIDFTIKTEVTYYYNLTYSSASGTSKDTESLTMKKGTNVITKNCSCSIPRNVSDCTNIKIASLIYSASGTIS